MLTKSSLLFCLLVSTLMPLDAAAQNADRRLDEDVESYDFESWYNPVMDDDLAIVPSGWSCAVDLNVGQNPGPKWGVMQTSEAKSGSYAVTVHHWHANEVGVLSLGEWQKPGKNAANLIRSGVPIAQTPARMSGFYKYDLGAGSPVDSAIVVILLKKYNASTRRSDTLSFVRAKLPAAAEYTHFSIPIPPPRGGVRPDSMAVAFLSASRTTWCREGFNCYFLSLDDVTFSSAAGVEMPVVASRLPRAMVFPNPVADMATISFDGRPDTRYRAHVVDMRGVEVSRHEFAGPRTDVATAGLSAGSYLVVVRDVDGRGIARARFIVD